MLIVVTSTDRRGAEVEAVELAEQLTAGGTPAEVVALAPGTGGGRVDVPTLGRTTLGLATLRALRRRARDHDLVIAYGSRTLPACAVGLIGSTPFVYRSIGDPARWAGGRARRTRTGLMLRRARGVVALWPSSAETLIALYRLHRAAVTVIPNARSARHFRPATSAERSTARSRLGIPQEAPALAIIGALSEEKRPLLAVEATATLDQAWVIIAGDGALADAVARASGQLLKHRHALLGSVEDVRTVFAAVDAVVLASRTEGMPGVLIEAALSGVPSVSTAVGAVPEMVAAGLPCTVVDVDCTPEAIGTALSAAIHAGPVEPPLRWTWHAVIPLWRTELEGWLDAQASGEIPDKANASR